MPYTRAEDSTVKTWLGDELRYQRYVLNLNRKEMAKACDMPYDTYCNIEGKEQSEFGTITVIKLIDGITDKIIENPIEYKKRDIDNKLLKNVSDFNKEFWDEDINLKETIRSIVMDRIQSDYYEKIRD